jgi:uncharacterized protein YkwD
MVLALVLAGCADAPPSSPTAGDLFARHTNLRAERGLPRAWNDTWATDHAQFHADRLAQGATNCSNLWHSPELGAWYTNRWAGENLACVPGCPSDGARAFNLWLGSPGHYQNIVNPHFEFIGIGVACSGSVEIVVAQYASW